MGRFFRKMIMLFVCSAFGVGCSVKENRSGCPCRLSLDFSEIDCGSIDSVVVTAFSGDGFTYSETVYSDVFDQKCVLLLPRSSQMNLSVVSGSEGLVEQDGSMTIPVGEDCPPVFMRTEELNTDCEILEKVVSLKKNYCRLNIMVEDDKYFAFQLVMRGVIDGYLSDGTPSEGEFRYTVPRVGGGYEVILPRQLDSSLFLDVNDGTDVLKTFALGEYLAASGYDWTSEDLKDVTVGIDYARTNLTISIQGWDKVYEFDFVI